MAASLAPWRAARFAQVGLSRTRTPSLGLGIGAETGDGHPNAYAKQSGDCARPIRGRAKCSVCDGNSPNIRQ